jgi:hypothetical protein
MEMLPPQRSAPVATTESGIRVDDGGVSLGRTLGARALRAMLFLSQHPEIEHPGWSGKVEFNIGGKSVKGSVHPAAAEIVG